MSSVIKFNQIPCTIEIIEPMGEHLQKKENHWGLSWTMSIKIIFMGRGTEICEAWNIL